MEQIIFDDIRRKGQKLLSYNNEEFERFIYKPSLYRGIIFKVKKEHFDFIEALQFTNIEFYYTIV